MNSCKIIISIILAIQLFVQPIAVIANSHIHTRKYDAKNQLDLVKQNNTTVANYDWKADGLLDKVTYQNNTTRNYVYDSADRVSSITNNFSNSQSETFGYGYDANSNRITETKAATNQAAKSINYQYDSLDRLSQVSTTTPVTSQIDYTYDAVGNRRSEVGVDQYGNNVNRTATFDDLNQLKTLSNGSVSEAFDYDDNGNLVETKLNNSVVTKFEYDIRNQLSKYEGVGTGINVTFDYDFERKRTSKTSSISTTNYTYAGNQVVNETSNNVISASYTIGGGEIVKSEFVGNNPETNYHFTDALGSVTSLTNNQGSLTTRSEYNAFGEQSGGIGSSNSIGYTGQRLDNETGLMALGNGERYYSPSYARFIQQDSFSGNGSIPQSLNRFAYGLNNPNKYTDPTGHIADDNRGSLANSAREYGINKDGETSTWGIFKNTLARTGYDLWDTISFGALSREEENVAGWEKGEITTEQARWGTFKNIAYSGAQVGLMVATAGAGTALTAGAGLATRVAVGAGLGAAEKFGSDLLGMGFGYQKDFSSARDYAISTVTGGVFGAASPGKGATALAKESKLTLGTELKLLGQETKELAQNIGQRLNPKNYDFKLNQNVLGSNGGGFEVNVKGNSARTTLKTSENLAQIAKDTHNILRPEGTDLRSFNNSTVAVAKVNINGKTSLYASGNGAKLTPKQRAKLVELGVPNENILGYPSKHKLTIDGETGKLTKLANHAERVIERNIPNNAVIEEWGISWASKQKNQMCENCVDYFSK